MRNWLILVCLFTFISPLFAQDSHQNAQVEKFIRELNSDEFEIREKAQEWLIKNYVLAQKSLWEMDKNIKKGEARVRLDQIFQAGQAAVLQAKLSLRGRQQNKQIGQWVYSGDDKKLIIALTKSMHVQGLKYYGLSKEDRALLLGSILDHITSRHADWTKLSPDLRNYLAAGIKQSADNGIKDSRWPLRLKPLLRMNEGDDKEFIRASAHSAYYVTAARKDAIQEALWYFDNVAGIRAIPINALRELKSYEAAPRIRALDRKKLSWWVRWHVQRYLTTLYPRTKEARGIVREMLEDQVQGKGFSEYGYPDIFQEGLRLIKEWNMEKEFQPLIKKVIKTMDAVKLDNADNPKWFETSEWKKIRDKAEMLLKQ